MDQVQRLMTVEQFQRLEATIASISSDLKDVILKDINNSPRQFVARWLSPPDPQLTVFFEQIKKELDK
jgi:hypothetical protein